VPIVPELPPAAPRFGNALTRVFGRALLRPFGWRVIGRVPDRPKLVAIAAPHTCSLDVFLGVAVILALGLRVRWLAKHTTFRWGLGPIVRAFGAVSVNRGSPAAAIRAVIDMMRHADRCYLALAPEGTRRKVERWKTGFYRIASAAAVPIVPVALDYSRRVVDIGEPMMPTGNYDADLARLKQHFGAHMARHPERY
jgi:1-acyl-sn-glycerol-3-phosphate acyltransferase